MTTTLVGAKVEEGDEFCIGASWLQGCFAEGWTHLDSFARSALIVEVAGEGFSTVWNGITPKGELQEPKNLCHRSNARQWRGHVLIAHSSMFQGTMFCTRTAGQLSVLKSRQEVRWINLKKSSPSRESTWSVGPNDLSASLTGTFDPRASQVPDKCLAKRYSARRILAAEKRDSSIVGFV
jgi:hypothetical protein